MAEDNSAASIPPPLPWQRESGEEPPRLPFPFYSEAALLAASFLAVQIGFGLILGVAAALAAFATGQPFNDIIGNASVYGLFLNVPAVVPALIWGWWRIGGRFPAAIGLRRTSSKALAAMIPLCAGSAILMSEMDNLLRAYLPIPNLFEDLFAGFAEKPLLFAVVVVVVAPLTEEPLFRGLLLDGFMRRNRPWKGLLMTSALFALIHINPCQVVVAFPLGLVLGWAYLRTRSLWPCILGHALLNSSSILTAFLPFEIAGFNSDPGAGLFQPLWFDALGTALLGLGILLMPSRKGDPVPPDDEGEKPEVIDPERSL